MTFEQIVKLAEMGFSKVEILELSRGIQTSEEPKPEQPTGDQEPAHEQEESQEEPQEEPKVDQKVEPKAEPKADPNEPTMSDIMKSISNLTKAVQANAVSLTSIPSKIVNPPKAEDMLAEIIRPTYGKEV